MDAAPNGNEAFFVTDITGAMELWKVPANGGWPTQLSDLGEQVSSVDISPNGKEIVLASDYGGDERPDLFLIPTEGGPAENITKSTRAETSPAYSPDGKRLAFIADPAEPFVFNLFVMDLATRQERQLTRENINVFFPVWSPDGKLIAATRTGDDRAGDLVLAAADGSMIEYGAPPVKGGIVIPQAWAPDGKSLLTVAEDEKGFHRLYLIATAGKGRFIGPSDWDVEHAEWNKAAGILFTRNEGGASALYRLRTPDAKLERLTPTKGRVEGISLDRAGKTVFYDWSDSSHAPDAWKLDLVTGKRTQLTRSMLGGVKPAELAQGEIVSYPSFDGKVVSAIYLKPPVARLGTPPPIVVMAHGGPDWQSFDDFHPMRQSLAEAGFAVLAPNFRGSTGFGRAFLDANRKDWGGGDRKDMIAGVKFLAARGDDAAAPASPAEATAATRPCTRSRATRATGRPASPRTACPISRSITSSQKVALRLGMRRRWATPRTTRRSSRSDRLSLILTISRPRCLSSRAPMTRTSPSPKRSSSSSASKNRAGMSGWSCIPTRAMASRGART